MLQQIADLVEFDLKRFSPEQVIDDLNHKFHNSWLKIDGKYYKFRNAGFSRNLPYLDLELDGADITLKELKTIEKVLPKTGLYASKESLIYLYRVPYRQWIKSLAIGQNYKTKILVNKHPLGPALFNTILIPNPTYAKETIIYDNKVFLHWKEVGRVEEGTIVVTDNLFFEEVKELWKYEYQISLEAKRHQPKVEKLILDF